MTLIGGRPGAGKTTWATALAIDVVEENPDTAVFYMSIDDTTELMTMKMLAARTGFSTSKIKRMQSLSVDERQVIRDARSWLNNLKKRFVMVDAGEGTTPEVMEAHIEWFLREYHDKKKIFLLDNFHKLKVPTANQKSDAISQLSEKIKELTRLYDIHIMMTVELRKMGENSSRPTPSDLKDSVQLEYDADVIIMAHNDKQVNQDTTIVWEGMYGDEGIKTMPFIEVTVHKNKMTGKTGGLAYKLNSYNLQIEEDSYSTIKTLKSKNAKSTFTIGK
jgi:replicative DNA helicase